MRGDKGLSWSALTHSLYRWLKKHPRTYWQAPLIVLSGSFYFSLWFSVDQPTAPFADLKTANVDSYAAKIIPYWRGKNSGADHVRFNDNNGIIFDTLGLTNEQEEKIKTALTHDQQVVLRYNTRGNNIPFFRENLIYQIEASEGTPLTYEETASKVTDIRDGMPWASLFGFFVTVSIILLPTIKENSRKERKMRRDIKENKNSAKT